MPRSAPMLLVLSLAACASRQTIAPGPSFPAPSPPKSGASIPDSHSDEFAELDNQYVSAKPIRSFGGKATYYADSLAGNKMASGEIYDPKRPLAAHRSLPFGTVVRVTNLQSGQTVVVKIADRGPFGKGRVIDLSRAAAARVGMLRAGVAKVRVDVLEAPTR